MYQTVGHQIIVSYAECMGVPLFRRRIRGSTKHQGLSYRMTSGDEVEDMFVLLNEVKRQIPSVTAVSSGAIASDYQRLRVESVCSRLGLVSLAYLWKQDQSLLLQEMITNSIVAIIVKVAAIGLDPVKHLGKEIAYMKPHLHKLKELYGINVCGEGGEYETLTLDCPLFVNARIVLDEFQVVRHSSDSVAPVGVLHPLAFHLERKGKSIPLSDDRTVDDSQEKLSFVVEVQEDCPQRCETICQPVPKVNDLVEATKHRLHISKTKKDTAFSICCWLEDLSESSAGLQEDLNTVLREIELQFTRHGFGWENVQYIHLYISDMNEFAAANETYTKFITQEKCPFGVPSRSTIELPLEQAGLGRAYVEVLVGNDQSKRVLHVQSISCWAPSCIGPYSQATLHKEVLHMAGQLGLDPPTMALCCGGPAAELEQALQNSEAIAKSFNCSISTSAILFVVFCSIRISSSERLELHDNFDAFLEQTRCSHSNEGSPSEVIEPIFLYLLVPDLPKRALVEVKPILYVEGSSETTNGTVQDHSCSMESSYWGFQPAKWHDSCTQKCLVDGKICAVILSLSSEHVTKICSDPLNADQNNTRHKGSLTKGQMERVSRFCIYILDKTLVENGFSWEDTMNLRLYFPANILIPMETLSGIFTSTFRELAEMGRIVRDGGEPIFNLIPVVGAGRSAASMDDIFTCELFARKF